MNEYSLAHHSSARRMLITVVLVSCGGPRVARTQRPWKGPTVSLSGFGKSAMGSVRCSIDYLGAG